MHRHHIYQADSRLRLSFCHNGLVQPVCALLEVVQYINTEFCLDAFREALTIAKPEIFNFDQGVQFISEGHTSLLKESGIKISMDGRGRVFDNIFIERLWRSLKYEDIYIKDYQSIMELKAGLQNYFHFYNRERPHQSLENKTPFMQYYGVEYRKTA